MNYYFFAASLPMLFLETPPLLSYDKFREICKEHLTGLDLEALDELLEPPAGQSRHGFVNDWREIEIQLRNSMAKIRAARLRRDASVYLREHKGFDTYVDKAASDAFSKSNPMERELALDKFRWGGIEDITGYNHFSGRAILAYALKLRMAERWVAMSEEEGREKAEEIVKQGVEGDGKG